MRIFRPEVESVLKTLGVLSLVALVLAPIAWGYEQRRQARAWQSVACAYRLRDLAQRAPIIRVDYVADPCGVLHWPRITVHRDGGGAASPAPSYATALERSRDPSGVDHR